MNRKKVDRYNPVIKVDRAAKERERMKHLIEDAESIEQLDTLIGSVPEELKGLWNERMNLLTTKS